MKRTEIARFNYTEKLESTETSFSIIAEAIIFFSSRQKNFLYLVETLMYQHSNGFLTVLT